MANNRVLAAAFGVVIASYLLAALILGHTAGTFVGMSPLLLWTVFFIAALPVLVFTPAVMLKFRWTAAGAIIAGLIRIIVAISLLANAPLSVTIRFGAAVGLILALFFTYFSFRAYREK